METLNEFECGGEGTNARRGGNAGQGNMTVIVGNYSAPMPCIQEILAMRSHPRSCTCRSRSRVRQWFFCLRTDPPTIATVPLLYFHYLETAKTFLYPKKFRFELYERCKYESCIKIRCQQWARLTFAEIKSYYAYSLNSETSYIY